MDVGATRRSPIGELVPISGTDWRTGEAYQHFAYVPNPLPDTLLLAGPTRAAIDAAADKLALLDLIAGKLRRAAIPRARVASLFEPGATVAQAHDWLSGKPLNAELVNGLHAALVDGTRGDAADAGRLRRGHVFLGAERGPVERSRFVPAPHGDCLSNAFEAWIQWLNRTDSHLSPVVQAGLAHYQFETLHPYSDGNGRVGRLAIVLMLMRRGVLRDPILAIAPWLERHRDDYQDGLLELSRGGDWDRWLAFFATAIGGAADTSARRLQALLHDELKLAITRRPARAARPSRRPAGVAAAVIATLSLAACGGSSSSKTSGVKGKSEVLAAPVSTAGDNPFTPTVGTDKGGIKPPTAAASTTGGPATYVASLPGLYGGTRNYKSCDAQKLVTFLQQNPSKATAWASTLGISTSSISKYVSQLTPVLLRTDTRVTNHGYVNGTADPIQSVLEAGTAVFLNPYGEPVVKCYCGNPLTAPTLLSAPVYTGPLWTSFNITNITIIQQSKTVINTYTLYDPNTGTEFKRGAGANGKDGPYISGPTTPGTPSTAQPSPSTTPGTSVPAENPSVSLSPNPVTAGGTVTLSATGFAPNVGLTIDVSRPDGGSDPSRSTQSDSSGNASYTFPNAGGSLTGTYTVTVTDPRTGAHASATIDVVAPSGQTGSGSGQTGSGQTGSGQTGSGQTGSGQTGGG